MKGFHIEKQLKKNYRAENNSFINQPIPNDKISLERKLEGEKPVYYTFESDNVLVKAAQKEEDSTTKFMERIDVKISKNNQNSFLSAKLPLKKTVSNEKTKSRSS